MRPMYLYKYMEAKISIQKEKHENKRRCLEYKAMAVQIARHGSEPSRSGWLEA